MARTFDPVIENSIQSMELDDQNERILRMKLDFLADTFERFSDEDLALVSKAHKRVMEEVRNEMEGNPNTASVSARADYMLTSQLLFLEVDSRDDFDDDLLSGPDWEVEEDVADKFK